MLGLCVWWNVALIAEFGTGLMNRQRLELGKNAYDAFVTLPRTAARSLGLSGISSIASSVLQPDHAEAWTRDTSR